MSGLCGTLGHLPKQARGTLGRITSTDIPGVPDFDLASLHHPLKFAKSHMSKTTMKHEQSLLSIRQVSVGLCSNINGGSKNCMLSLGSRRDAGSQLRQIDQRVELQWHHMIRRSPHPVVNFGLDVQFRLRVGIKVIMSWHNKYTRITTCCSDSLWTDETAGANLRNKHGFHGQCNISAILAVNHISDTSFTFDFKTTCNSFHNFTSLWVHGQSSEIRFNTSARLRSSAIICQSACHLTYASCTQNFASSHLSLGLFVVLRDKKRSSAHGKGSNRLAGHEIN